VASFIATRQVTDLPRFSSRSPCSSAPACVMNCGYFFEVVLACEMSTDE
jgi:hypothetical protein